MSTKTINHWIVNNPSGDPYYFISLKPLNSSDFQKQSLDWYQNWLVDWTMHTWKQNQDKKDFVKTSIRGNIFCNHLVQICHQSIIANKKFNLPITTSWPSTRPAENSSWETPSAVSVQKVKWISMRPHKNNTKYQSSKAF